MYLAWQEIKRNKARFTMIGVIILLITWLVFLLTGLGTGLGDLSAAAIKNLNGDHLIFEEDSDNKFTKSLISGDMVNAIEKIEGVKAGTPMGSMITSIQNVTKNDDKKIDATSVGILPHSFIEPKVIEGKGLDETKPQEVIVDDLLKNDGFKLGDQLKFTGFEEEFTIVGFIQKNTFNHLASIWMNLDKWQGMRFAAPGSDDGVKNPVNTIVLQTEKEANLEKISKDFKRVQVATRKQTVQSMPGYKEENGTISLMLAFLIGISAVIIGVFFYVLTMQKSQQFGVMKAIGANNKFISKMIISQVSIISFISIALGIGLTYGIASILPAEMPFSLDNKLILIYGIGIFAISVLSTLFSLRQIVKIDPLVALGRAE